MLGDVEEGETVGEVVAHELELLGREFVLAREAEKPVLVAHVELKEGGREGGHRRVHDFGLKRDWGGNQEVSGVKKTNKRTCFLAIS